MMLLGKGEGGCEARPAIAVGADVQITAADLPGGESSSPTAAQAAAAAQEIISAVGPAVLDGRELEPPRFEGDDWKERRAEWVSNLTSDLHQGLAKYLSTDEGWKAWVSRPHVHSSSMMNQMWAMIQLASKNGGLDAPQVDLGGLVLSATAWEKLGRKVKPDCRRFGTRAAEDDRFAVTQLRPAISETIRIPIEWDDATGEPSKFKRIDKPLRREDGSIVYTDFVGYHIDATEGDPLPESPLGHATGSPQDAARLIADVEAMCKANGVTVSYGQPTPGARGHWNASAKEIVIDESLTGAERAAVLVHEAVHYVGGDAGRGDGRRTDEKEIETEAAAWIIQSKYGLTGDGQTLPYLAGWTRENPDKVLQLSSRIQGRCELFFRAVDPVHAAIRGRGKRKAPAKKRKAAKKKPAAKKTAAA